MHNKKLRFQCLNNGNLYRGICFGSIDIQFKVSVLKEKSLSTHLEVLRIYMWVLASLHLDKAASYTVNILQTFSPWEVNCPAWCYSKNG